MKRKTYHRSREFPVRPEDAKQYLLALIPPQLWADVNAKAKRERVAVRAVLLRLASLWVSGAVEAPALEAPVAPAVEAPAAPIPRYVVRERRSGIGNRTAAPYQVVDLLENRVVDEYRSKRAATMHARALEARCPRPVFAIEKEWDENERVIERNNREHVSRGGRWQWIVLVDGTPDSAHDRKYHATERIEYLKTRIRKSA